MASSNEKARSDPAGNESNDSDKTSSSPNSAREVTPEKAAEIARNLQQVFTKIGQQPVPPRLQEIIDRMAEEERRNE